MRSRLLVAALGASIALAGIVTGTPIAGAEWDIGQYDRCIADVKFAYREGDISTAEMVRGYDLCCTSSGGVIDGNNCGAPPLISASTQTAPPSEAANPDVPAGAPPTAPPTKTPRTPLTLAPIVPVG